MEERLNVLKLLDKLLGDSLWILTGSTSLFLQGVNVEAKDIDILTDRSNAIIIDGKLQKYCTYKMNYSSTEKIRSYFGKYIINCIQIEVMGDLQHCLESGKWSELTDVNSKRKYIKFDELQIPVLSLEDELEGYKKMGRFVKAKLIEDTLNEV